MIDDLFRLMEDKLVVTDTDLEDNPTIVAWFKTNQHCFKYDCVMQHHIYIPHSVEMFMS